MVWVGLIHSAERLKKKTAVPTEEGILPAESSALERQHGLSQVPDQFPKTSPTVMCVCVCGWVVLQLLLWEPLTTPGVGLPSGLEAA